MQRHLDWLSQAENYLEWAEQSARTIFRLVMERMGLGLGQDDKR